MDLHVGYLKKVKHILPNDGFDGDESHGRILKKSQQNNKKHNPYITGLYNPFITQPTGVSNTARLRWAQFFITTSIFQLGALPWQSLWLSLACLHRWKGRWA